MSFFGCSHGQQQQQKSAPDYSQWFFKATSDLIPFLSRANKTLSLFEEVCKKGERRRKSYTKSVDGEVRVCKLTGDFHLTANLVLLRARRDGLSLHRYDFIVVLLHRLDLLDVMIVSKLWQLALEVAVVRAEPLDMRHRVDFWHFIARHSLPLEVLCQSHRLALTEVKLPLCLGTVAILCRFDVPKKMRRRRVNITYQILTVEVCWLTLWVQPCWIFRRVILRLILLFVRALSDTLRATAAIFVALWLLLPSPAWVVALLWFLRVHSFSGFSFV